MVFVKCRIRISRIPIHVSGQHGLLWELVLRQQERWAGTCASAERGHDLGCETKDGLVILSC
jgi:hypothetical protein